MYNTKEFLIIKKFQFFNRVLASIHCLFKMSDPQRQIRRLEAELISARTQLSAAEEEVCIYHVWLEKKCLTSKKELFLQKILSFTIVTLFFLSPTHSYEYFLVLLFPKYQYADQCIRTAGEILVGRVSRFWFIDFDISTRHATPLIF